MDSLSVFPNQSDQFTLAGPDITTPESQPSFIRYDFSQESNAIPGLETEDKGNDSIITHEEALSSPVTPVDKTLDDSPIFIDLTQDSQSPIFEGFLASTLDLEKQPLNLNEFSSSMFGDFPTHKRSKITKLASDVPPIDTKTDDGAGDAIFKSLSATNKAPEAETISNGAEMILVSPDTQALDQGRTMFFTSPILTCIPTPIAIPALEVWSKKVPCNKLTCRERKRIVISSIRCPSPVKKAMQIWLETTNRLLDPFREDDECWFHPSPPSPLVTTSGNLRPRGKIQRNFSWQDRNGKHNLVINFGIVSKILFRTMTKLQKDGFINKQWHLSHLCGNWTCLNPDHTTVEPGSVNVSRNNCFSHRGGCFHDPKCMKEKKAYLGADGIPIVQDTDSQREMKEIVIVDDDAEDWVMQNFDDDQDFFSTDNDQVADHEVQGSDLSE